MNAIGTFTWSAYLKTSVSASYNRGVVIRYLKQIPEAPRPLGQFKTLLPRFHSHWKKPKEEGGECEARLLYTAHQRVCIGRDRKPHVGYTDRQHPGTTEVWGPRLRAPLEGGAPTCACGLALQLADLRKQPRFVSWSDLAGWTKALWEPEQSPDPPGLSSLSQEWHPQHNLAIFENLK